jgi:diketogulonate reductase-like aldo/keto reductase
MTTRTTGAGRVASHSGTFRIEGERPVVRLGFGAMRITGPGIWGPPRDHDQAIRVLRRAVALGVTFIDTARFLRTVCQRGTYSRGALPIPG